MYQSSRDVEYRLQAISGFLNAFAAALLFCRHQLAESDGGGGRGRCPTAPWSMLTNETPQPSVVQAPAG